MEWIARGYDDSQVSMSNERKTGHIQIWRQDQASVAQALYATTRSIQLGDSSHSS